MRGRALAFVTSCILPGVAVEGHGRIAHGLLALVNGVFVGAEMPLRRVPTGQLGWAVLALLQLVQLLLAPASERAGRSPFPCDPGRRSGELAGRRRSSPEP